MSLQDVSQKACAYEVASEFVDGMDVLAVREADERAVERGPRKNSYRRCWKSVPIASWAIRCLIPVIIAPAPR